jgi:hypothetical protein
MADRWRGELRRLSALEPDDGLLSRAREGPHRDLDEGPKVPKFPKFLVVLVALAVFGTAGLLTWQAFTPGSGPGRHWQPGYPSPPASGYYILFPGQDGVHPSGGGDGFGVTLTALTNLPDGTLVEVSAGDAGTCCPPVKNGSIDVAAGNQSCYGPVGDAANSPGFDVEITVRPDTDRLVFPGPGQAGPPRQPQSVLDVLGPHFENLTGDQVVGQSDGSKWLVAKDRYQWPEPQCGGDPIPLFGGSRCEPTQFQQQLQGNTLEEAMGDVMGAIDQGRACEFWSVMLPPDVEAQHAWPAFAAEWRPWLLEQDFSDTQPAAPNWTTGGLHWMAEPDTGQGSAGTTVDVIHDGQRIATLQVQPLPDYCPHCSANVVPFWGVTDWTLYPSNSGTTSP